MLFNAIHVYGDAQDKENTNDRKWYIAVVAVLCRRFECETKQKYGSFVAPMTGLGLNKLP